MSSKKPPKTLPMENAELIEIYERLVTACADASLEIVLAGMASIVAHICLELDEDPKSMCSAIYTAAKKIVDTVGPLPTPGAVSEYEN
jgi:hypothetical protein